MVKLSMPAGLMIEAAIAGGVEGDHLIEVIREKKISALSHIGKSEESWQSFFKYAEEHWEDIVLAIKNGFTFKFITIKGLQNLLLTRISFKEENLKIGDSWLELKLNESQLTFLLSRIPHQWLFIKQEDSESPYNYRAVLAQRHKVTCKKASRKE
ncbi:hypothetical protein [Fictibacillus phosphorivorans]|uniref:hypothetical protein n=1 Tax=Fictibacillus phosphorivorans TaxID=1221500 RepID=UPI0020403576|nr:hypothetical protein [Fictibacillus phosphorivorans]MCM3719330.1 hypothetical protein [Fictibacillus phosphorivorans]MCM3776951.1 hypothetical protein [Fictibacillus phosphorivorans]